MKFKEYTKKSSNEDRTKPLLLEGVFVLDNGKEVVASINQDGITINQSVSEQEKDFIHKHLNFDWEYKKDFLKEVKVKAE